MQEVMGSEKWTNLRHSKILGNTKQIQKIFIESKMQKYTKLFMFQGPT